ncbi:MAG: hypothetical protein WBD23_11075 [Candidatus Acidiferrales bacterium]
MKRLQPFSKFVALLAVLLWCACLSGAQQVQKIPAKPASAKAAAAKTAPAKQAVSRRAARRASIEAKRKVGAMQRVPEKAAVTKPAPVRVEPQKPSLVAPLPPPPPVAVEEATHARDPFSPLVRATEPSAGHSNLPPGIAGLQVATVRLEGMIKTPDGVMAVVANPEDHVYFLHTGDHIFDGLVEKIELGQITFQQENKDAFGRVVERDVTKQLYPIAGDEQ